MGLAAVAMAASMFAADPAFNPSLAEYSGNASVKWGVNLDDGMTGFTNAASATLKFNLFTAGDKATSGDGIWADMKIKNDGNDGGSMVVPSASVDYAKFHIYDLYIGIMSGDVKVGGCKPQTAILSGNVGIGEVGTAQSAGIVAGYANDYFGIDVDFRSAPGYTNDYAIAAEASLKAVADLELKAGVTSDFDSVAYAASASYKIAMGDNYLKPTVGYNSNNEIVGAVLYAWGDEADANAGVYYLGDAYKKVTPGVSVIYTKDLDLSADLGTIDVAFNLGSKVENLKVAALAEVGMVKVLDEVVTGIEVRGGVAYDIKADDITITTKAGAAWTKDASVEVSAGVDFAGLINNTTFSVEYVSGNLMTPVKGTIDFTAKISL